MSTLPMPRYTLAEYLRFERNAQDRHEFIDGMIVAMAGGTEPHSLITVNTAVALQTRLRGRCRVYGSDMLVCIREDRLPSYPDVTVVCGDRQFLAGDPHVLVNPSLIVEVLSPSAEKYDRGHKSALFREIASMQAYLLIAQRPVDIEYQERQPDGSWSSDRFSEREALIPIRPFGIELPVSEIYLDVE